MARAFLRRLGGRRTHFGRLVLLDKTDQVRRNLYLEHRRLAYRFVRHHLRFPKDGAYYRQLLRRYRIDIVVDLTDADLRRTMGQAARGTALRFPWGATALATLETYRGMRGGR